MFNQTKVIIVQSTDDVTYQECIFLSSNVLILQYELTCFKGWINFTLTFLLYEKYAFHLDVVQSFSCQIIIQFQYFSVYGWMKALPPTWRMLRFNKTFEEANPCRINKSYSPGKSSGMVRTTTISWRNDIVPAPSR